MESGGCVEVVWIISGVCVEVCGGVCRVVAVWRVYGGCVDNVRGVCGGVWRGTQWELLPRLIS